MSAESFFPFVYGEENRMCIQALQDCLRPKADATPILLVGKSGCGKTLLLNMLHKNFADTLSSGKIKYQTGKEVVGCIVDRVLEEDGSRLSRYQDLDVLLIDDLAAVRGKFSTQRELLWFIEGLQKCGTRVVCTLPEDSIVEEPVAKGFPGIILKLSPPSFATAKRIVRHKAKARDIEIPHKKISRIAAKANGNGFLMEGAVKRCAFQKALPNLIP